MVYALLHPLIVIFYLAAPVVALIGDGIYSIRKRRGVPSSQFVMTLSAAVILGTALALIYGIGVGGRVSLIQIFLCIYFAAGLLLLLKGFDWLVTRGMRRALKRWLQGDRQLARHGASAGIGLVRIALLLGIGLPYIMAAIMTYRPKVVPRDDPMSQLGFAFEAVSFQSTDGVRLAGWWIPAAEPRRRGFVLPDDFGAKTVIACHGLAGNKSNQLILARELIGSGYNVLIFDFRAHGESGGQLTGLGALERRDVLGAVRWLQENRPLKAQRIHGVGASLGAAALIAAAADDSAEGRAIQSVAVYGTYDDLLLLTRDIAGSKFLPPLNRLVPTLGLHIASAQTGADLRKFRPGDEIVKLWPRPVLVIHGQSDEIIPIERGRRLFNLALHPKQSLWLPFGDHNQIVEDDEAARAVREFFDTAEPLQML